MESIEKSKYFNNRYFEMWLENDMVHVKYHPNVVVDLEAAIITLKDRLEFVEGKSYVYYVDVRKAKYWTKEAREYQASDANHEGVKAFAMHISSPIQRSIVKFYLYFNKPKVPTNCFPTKEAALNWLQQFK